METRAAEVPGLVLPTWRALQQHGYPRWEQDRLVLDTARVMTEQAAACVLAAVPQCHRDHRSG